MISLQILFRMYWQALLHSAYLLMVDQGNVTWDFTTKESFMPKFRYFNNTFQVPHTKAILMLSNGNINR